MSLFSSHHVTRSLRQASNVCWSFAAVAIACGAPTWLSAGLRIFPEEIHLQGSPSRQRLIVERIDEYGQSIGQVPLSDELRWSVGSGEIVAVEDGVVLPRKNGVSEVSVQDGAGHTAKAKVVVGGMEHEPHWEFRRHVLPVLTKAGCNQGACHGALAGKGGFKLSLRGYNPFGDHYNITRQTRGRRIEPQDPGRSLLLTKPTGAVAHKGGLRLEIGSRDYQILSQWIVQGARAPDTHDPQLESLEVLPPHVRLRPHDRQQLLVRARYTDGRVEDVTEWARFTSTDESLARVAAGGEVQVTGHGEGAVSVWFSSKIVMARIASPYDHALQPDAMVGPPRANFIDDLVLDKLQQLNLAPSPRCGDEVFIRRAFLDTIGTLPTPQEVTAFLADRSPDKRSRLIDQLLTRSEFVDYWSYRWSDLFLLNGRRLRPAAIKAYYDWIRGHVRDNTPWDQMVRDVITARGSSFDNGATNFYALHQSAEDMAENACQAFLGLSIGCAKCHNHPLEKWTNDQYYGMANLFARVRAKGWGGEGRGGDGLRILAVADAGDVIQPLTGRAQVPTPLDGQPVDPEDPRDRRESLAVWLTAPENPYFARAIANRIWANYLGVGLVEPVDDLRISNPASNERLLEALSQYLIAEKFDLRRLMRVILNSETYQRASETIPENAEDRRYYSHYYPRRMMAEVLLDAVAQVTGVPSRFNRLEFDGMDFEEISVYPAGTRALQLYDSAVDSPFLNTFGRNARDITCECERSNTPTMVQVLHMNNGTTINDRLRDPRGWIAQWISSPPTTPQIVEEAYLRTLSRRPSPQVQEQLVELIEQHEPALRREAIEDLYWSLLSSREFTFHH